MATQSKKHDNQHKNHVIFIIGSVPNFEHPDKSKLILSDAGDTTVDPGDTVVWINMVSGISSFLIRDDNKISNVFEPDPSPVQGSTNWKGTVKLGILNAKQKQQSERYTICWSQDGMTFCYDPVIKLNP
jgi:hypothetical protein